MVTRIGLPAAAILVSLSGCMLTPSDDQRVDDPAAPILFRGFTTVPGAPVQILVWDRWADAMTAIGDPVTAALDETPGAPEGLYYWEASRRLDARFWRFQPPPGGQCAVVGARSGGTNLLTVEPDWGDCFNENPSVEGFVRNCRADNSPVAKLYSSQWVDTSSVSQPWLNLAGAIASRQHTFTLDNYTSSAYESCSETNPGGCPTGVSDPETYKFYAPDGSSIVNDEGYGIRTVRTFSIRPARDAPKTIYVDDMRSERLAFRPQGSRFIMEIHFENADPEIRTDCIRDGACGIPGRGSKEFPFPRADLSFALGVEAGRVVFTDVVTSFDTGGGGAALRELGEAIGAAITESVTSVPVVRRAVNGLLDQVIHGAAGLSGFPFQELTIAAGSLSVRPGCPLD